jgi:hypothetical protein
MRNQKLRAGLNRLVREFDRIAVPEHGRYVRAATPSARRER